MLNRLVQIPGVSKNINYPNEVHIGNNMYLVEKDFLGIHKQTIYSSPFQRSKDFINGVGIHFEYNGMFNVKGKLLEVEIKYFICYGPLGDRLNLGLQKSKLSIEALIAKIIQQDEQLNT